MKKFSRKLLTGLAISAAFLSFQANAIEMRGQATFKYEGGIFSSGPSDAERNATLNKAKVSAIEKYAASLGPAQQRLMRELRGQIESNPDEFLHGFHVIAEDTNSNSKNFTVVIRADVNEARFNEELRKNTSASQTASGEGSTFSGLFVARQVIESRIFDERKISITQSSDSISGGAEGDGEYATKTNKTATGGSRVRKASKNTYAKLSSTDFDAEFNNVLTSRGFEFTDYADVASECRGPKLQRLQQAFAKSDELPQDLRKQAIKAAQKCGVQYFAVGYMNVGGPITDPVSGNIKVGVSINGMVWNIQGRLPKRVGSVGPVQYFGFGPDDEAAKKEALRLAAENAAETITAQLGLKNLK